MNSKNNKKLSAQAQRILDVLSDGNTHCGIDWRYSDGHGKRLTDINRYLGTMGKKLGWAWCDCGRHTTKIKMRWIEDAPKSANSAPTAIKMEDLIQDSHQSPNEQFYAKQAQLL